MKTADVERLRPDFERLANSNAACGLKRSLRGTYVNPAIARDWKWFQLGAIAKSTVSANIFDDDNALMLNARDVKAMRDAS